MGSATPKAFAAVRSMSKLALRDVEDNAATHCDPSASVTFRLLDLPAELRVRVYVYVGITHLEHFGIDISRRPALLATNKQLRLEFMDIYYYSRQVVKAHYVSFAPATWAQIRQITDRKLTKTLLDGKGQIRFWIGSLALERGLLDVVASMPWCGTKYNWRRGVIEVVGSEGGVGIGFYVRGLWWERRHGTRCMQKN